MSGDQVGTTRAASNIIPPPLVRSRAHGRLLHPKAFTRRYADSFAHPQTPNKLRPAKPLASRKASICLSNATAPTPLKHIAARFSGGMRYRRVHIT